MKLPYDWMEHLDSLTLQELFLLQRELGKAIEKKVN